MLVLAAAVVVASRHGLAALRPAARSGSRAPPARLARGPGGPARCRRRPALFDDHVVSFVKLAEYALLVPAIPLLVRQAEDLTIVLGRIVEHGRDRRRLRPVRGVDVFDAANAGWRQPSFLGFHDLAALSALALSVAIAAIVATRRFTPPGRFSLALVAGVVGMIVAGSVTAAVRLAVGSLLAVLAGSGQFRPSGRRLLALVTQSSPSSVPVSPRSAATR